MPPQSQQYLSPNHIAWIAAIFLSIGLAISIPFVEPLFIIVAIIGVVNMLLVLRYPFWGLLVYLIVFLFRPGEVYPALAAIRPELMLGGFVVIAILMNEKIKSGTIAIPTDTVTLSLFAFLAGIAVSVFTSYWGQATVNTCITFVKTLVFYYMIIAVIDNRRKFLAFVGVYCVMIGKVAYDSLRLYLAGGFVHTMGVDRLQGATSFGGDPNSLANTMAVSIPLIVAVALYSRNWIVRSLSISLALSMIYLIVITGSREGALAFLAVLGGGFLFAKKKAVIAVSALLIIVAAWFVMPDQYKDRYRTLTEIEDINETSSGRWDIWKSGVSMIVTRPILGVGAGAFPAALASGDFGRPRWMASHSLYIEVFATTGLVGSILWFGFFIRGLLKRLLALARLSTESGDSYWVSLFSKSFVISMMSMFTSGVFGHNLFRFNWYMIAGLTVAMCSILARSTKESTLPSPSEQLSKHGME